MSPSPRIGSLFSGYGGLELGVQAVLGGETAWVSDIDPGACRILAHRYPNVPNLGDVTAVNWAKVEPVDILTGGFPCQDVSHAGARAGMGPGTRSGLWSRMADAIDHLRPSLVIAENVRGLLSAEAASDVEPCPWCLGDGAGEPPLRALGAVLADLAELGYDASWYGLRAADVGAPHGRFRVFILAWPTGRPTDDASGISGGCVHGERVSAGREGARWLRVAADADGIGWFRGGPAALSRGIGPGMPGQPSRSASAPANAGREHGAARPEKSGGARSGRATDKLERPPTITAHTDSLGPIRAGGSRGWGSGSAHGDVAASVAWGPYEPAIRRWERRLGHPAPAPTERGSKGQPRLSPAFVEWMMGLPAGWVTDVPGLSRNDQLKALGNGVVPQQAAAAVRFMLARLDEERRWAA